MSASLRVLIRLSHNATWFQLAPVWSTNYNPLIRSRLQTHPELRLEPFGDAPL